MNWYLNVLRHYADFGGRARPKEYWMFALFNSIFCVLMIILDNVLGLTVSRDIPYGMFYYMYVLAVFIPGLAVTVRRLHDTGHSGWWIAVPVLNICVAVLIFLKGQQGDNRYGSDPKMIRSPYSEPARLRSAAITLIIAAAIEILDWGWFICGIVDDAGLSGLSSISAGYAGWIFSTLLLLAAGILILPRVPDGSVPAGRVRRRTVFPVIAYAAIVFFLNARVLTDMVLTAMTQQDEAIAPAVLINSAVWLLYKLVILLFALSLLLSGGRWRRVACTALAVASCMMIAYTVYVNYSNYGNMDGDVLDILLNALTFFPVAWLLLSGVFRTEKGASRTPQVDDPRYENPAFQAVKEH
jgi:uncharacterized membrane protein YhaH (DUF805 family)